MNKLPCKGFSLIEVLVALFVISIGLLGIAAMEIYSKESGNEAIQRSSAVFIAQEMMEKMRANPTVLASYVGVTVGNASVATPATDCKAGACTSSQLVTFDIWEWERMLDGVTETSGSNNTGGLVAPQGCITGPAGTAGVYTVSIAWRGTTPMNNPAAVTCGLGSGLYGASDEYRRVINIEFYISNDTFV